MKKFAVVVILCAIIAGMISARSVKVAEADSGNLIAPPAVIAELTTERQLEEIESAEIRPSSVVISPDEALKVFGGSEELTSVFVRIRSVAIPVIYVENRKTCDALAEFLAKVRNLDAAVMSEDPALIESMRSRLPAVRGILSIERSDSLWETASVANRLGAGCVLLKGELANRETVEYFQARMIAAWIWKADSRAEQYAAFTTGAGGIVTQNWRELYAIFDEVPDATLSRPIFNIAHRGLPGQFNENSLSGGIAAYEAGATHLEIDAYLTLDNQIVIMHDNSLERTSNGQGNIESMRLSEITRYRLDVHGDDPIPTADDFFDWFRGKDLVIVFEIKSAKFNFVQALREKIEAYDIWEQIVVITFNTGIINQMRRYLPEIAVADLNSVTDANFSGRFDEAVKQGYRFDLPYADLSRENRKRMTDRGFMLWMWTYASPVDALPSGVIGVTNNAADRLADHVRYLSVDRPIGRRRLERTLAMDNPRIEITANTYGGEKLPVEAKITWWEKSESGYRLVFSYRDGEYSLLSSPVEVPFGQRDAYDKRLSAVICLISAAVLIGIATALALLFRRRKKRRIKV